MKIEPKIAVRLAGYVQECFALGSFHPGLGFDWSKLVLAGTGSLYLLKPVQTGQISTKLINWPQRLTK